MTEKNFLNEKKTKTKKKQKLKLKKGSKTIEWGKLQISSRDNLDGVVR